jgi:hypothetical protein
MKDSDKILAALGAIVIIPVSIALNGWAISVMWAWFIVPFGLPQIGIAHAAGISALAGLFKSSAPKNDDDFITVAGKAIFFPLFILFFGWIIHLFMW